MYGTQTLFPVFPDPTWFENDVEMYGTQTMYGRNGGHSWFENDVEMYGTQTVIGLVEDGRCLRMM